MDQVAVERVLVIARELETAGRLSDAQLLARLAAEAGAEFEPDLSAEELTRRLALADADIARGRVTANESVWAEIDETRDHPSTSEHLRRA